PANSAANYNFGLVQPTTASVSGVTLEDLDGNPATTADQSPEGGVTVKLFNDVNGNGVLDAADGTPAATTTTAPVTGLYIFGRLKPGGFLGEEVPASGDTQIAPAAPGYYTVVVQGGTVSAFLNGTPVGNVNFVNSCAQGQATLAANFNGSAIASGPAGS